MASLIFFNKSILTIASILFILIFIHAGHNKEWLYDQTLFNWQQSIDMLSEDAETVKKIFWGPAYDASAKLKKHCREEQFKDPVILFEPNEYFEKSRIHFSAPIPVVFYYYSGLRGVWTNSKNVKDATHYVLVNNKTMALYPFKDKKEVYRFLAHYKKFKPKL